jgi:hypothetical protein
MDSSNNSIHSYQGTAIVIAIVITRNRNHNRNHNHNGNIHWKSLPYEISAGQALLFLPAILLFVGPFRSRETLQRSFTSHVATDVFYQL